MSGIYIPGMEMPKGCAFCKISRRNGKKMICPFIWKCEWDIHDPMSADHRLDNCPLIPVPEHGPLVDALEVINTFSEEFIFTNEQAKALTNYIIPADPAVMRYPQVPGITPTVIAEEVYDKRTDTAGNIHWTGTHSGKHIIPASGGDAK